jgi:hypothetical protein
MSTASFWGSSPHYPHYPRHPTMVEKQIRERPNLTKNILRARGYESSWSGTKALELEDTVD